MRLPICWSCKYSFKWRELFLYREGKKCPKCQAKQFLKTHSRWKSSVIVYPSFLFPMILDIFGSLPLKWVIVFSAILFLVIYSFCPFHFEFTDKQQPFF